MKTPISFLCQFTGSAPSLYYEKGGKFTVTQFNSIKFISDTDTAFSELGVTDGVSLNLDRLHNREYIILSYDLMTSLTMQWTNDQQQAIIMINRLFLASLTVRQQPTAVVDSVQPSQFRTPKSFLYSSPPRPSLILPVPAAEAPLLSIAIYFEQTTAQSSVQFSASTNARY